MPTLYYCPLACSVASHIALEEAGAEFQARKVNIFTGEHRKPEFLAINSRGTVPVLQFEDGRILLESTAILDWVGRTYPDAGLLGDDPLQQAQTVATCAWLASSVHPVFTRFIHPERYADDSAAHPALKAHAKRAYWSVLQEIDRMLDGTQWIMGDRFTVADPYALVFYPWGRELGLPVETLRSFTAMKNRLVERPAARRALEREESVLLKD